MANTIFSSEGALLFIMVATVALGFWLQRFKVFKTLGPALTVIVMGIVMSNLRIVPTSSPTYDAISGYCVPLSVSICLLSLDLKQMRKLSKEPIIALASAIFSVCVAALVFGVLFANKIDEGCPPEIVSSSRPDSSARYVPTCPHSHRFSPPAPAASHGSTLSRPGTW